MSQTAFQASAFYEEMASSRNVFTLLDGGSFLVFRVEEIEVVPFWSSRSRVLRVQNNHARYRPFECDQSGLDAFPRKRSLTWKPRGFTSASIGLEQS
jgi:hypothetical protein